MHMMHGCIIEIMETTIPQSRKELSTYAPRVSTITIERKNQRGNRSKRKSNSRYQETTGTTIFIEDDGTIQIAAVNKNSVMRLYAG